MSDVCIEPCTVHLHPVLRDEHVVRDVVQVTSVLEPGPSHADVISGTFAVHLEKEESICDVLPIPLVKRSQQLKTIAAQSERKTF